MKHPGLSNSKRVRAILRAVKSGDAASLDTSGVPVNDNLNLKKANACFVSALLGKQASGARLAR